MAGWVLAPPIILISVISFFCATETLIGVIKLVLHDRAVAKGSIAWGRGCRTLYEFLIFGKFKHQFGYTVETSRRKQNSHETMYVQVLPNYEEQ